ncbi:MAG: ABC transporter substrate-binding protein [Armatimonadetes bacterium]|nr:ABC transporter substrate-binding protein [Armatimonadota bacterium]
MMNLRRATQVAGLILAIVIFAGGAGTSLQAAPARPEAVIISAYPRDFRNIDPAHIPGSPDYQIAMNVFSTLVRYKVDSLDVEPDLAERYRISPNKRVFTFFLRKGVQCHKNFGELTARDVKFSFDRILDPATRSRYRASISQIQSIEVVDNYTVRFTLSSPANSFLGSVLAFRPGFIVCQKAFEQLGANGFQFTPVGSGPYQIVGYTPRQEIVLEAHAKYFRGAPAAKRIVWRVVPDENVAALALQRGEINHMISRDVQVYKALQRDSNLRFTATPTTGWWEVMINTRRRPLDDVRVRRALAHALDRETFVRTVLEGVGQPAYSIIPPGLFGHTNDVEKYPRNVARARQLLTEAGFPNGFRINVVYEPSDYGETISLALQQWFRDIGVTLDLVKLEAGAWTARRSAGDYDLTVSGTTRFEPDQFLSEQFHSASFPPAGNLSYYDQIDNLIEAQRRALNDRERTTIIQQIQRKVAQDVPFLPIFNPVYVTAYHRSQTGHPLNTAHWMTRFEFVKFAP